MSDLTTLSGTRVIESRYLPIRPSAGEDAKRIVRHGLADVLAWLGEDVGRKPGELTHAFFAPGFIYASAAYIEAMRRTGWVNG
jgi:hypothetical protein